MRYVLCLLVCLKCLVVSSSAVNAWPLPGDSIPKVHNRVTPSVVCNPVQIFTENFDAINVNSTSPPLPPSFSDYTRSSTAAGFGTYVIYPLSQSVNYYGIDVTSALCTGYQTGSGNNNVLAADTRGAGSTTGEVLWGRNTGSLQPGTYQLTFWIKTNSLFNNNDPNTSFTMEASVRNSSSTSPISGRVINAARQPIDIYSLNSVTGCGIQLYYEFIVPNSSYNNVCIIPNAPLSTANGADFLIDNITFTKVSPATPIPQVPPCVNGSPVTVTLANPGPGAYEWTQQRAGGPQVTLSQTGSSITISGYQPTDVFTVTAKDFVDPNCISAPASFILDFHTPRVADAFVCRGSQVVLEVSNALSGTDYEWFMVSGSNEIPVAAEPTSRILKAFVSQNTEFHVRTAATATCGPGATTSIQVTVLRVSPTVALAAVSGTGPYYRGMALQFTSGVGSTGTGTLYLWNWGDRSVPSTSASPVHTYSRAGTYQIALTATQRFATPTGSVPCSDIALMQIIIRDPLCDLIVPAPVAGVSPLGTIEREEETGAIQYTYGSALACAPATMLECLGEQPKYVSNVVASTNIAYADSLVQDVADYQMGTYANIPFLQGKRRYRPYATYTYSTPLAPSSNGLNLNFDAGKFALAAFNWQSSARARPNSWLAAGIAEQVTPDGETLQERDPLLVRSVAKFGYGSAEVPQGTGSLVVSNHALPYLVAQNADYQTTFFESFENIYGANSSHYGEDRYRFDEAEIDAMTYSTPAQHHTGSRAAKLAVVGTGYRLTLPDVPATQQVQQAGVVVKAWIYHTLSQLAGHVDLVDKPEDYAVWGTGPLEIVARNGDWVLVQAKVPLSPGLAVGYNLTPLLIINGATSTTSPPTVWIDDVRLQPGNSQMTAYVYDRQTLRLMASFDDQHFAQLYQYNPEGKLVRKLVETERGIKTIQETQYNTAKMP